MSHIVMAEAAALPGAADRLRAEIATLARAVRLEAGNERFDVYARPDRPGHWLMIERYRDKAAFERHLAMPHTKAFNAALAELAEGGASSVADLSASMASDAAAADVRGIDHVGITVPDIEAATAFFAAAFGARRLYDVQPAGAPPMAGEETERQLGLPARAQIVHMRLLRIGGSADIELFEVKGAAQAPAAGIVDLGLQHLAIHTDAIDAAAARFTEAGGTLLSVPHPLANQEDGPGNRGVYGRAPWGMLIELIQLPAGVSYPDDAILPRWKPLPHD